MHNKNSDCTERNSPTANPLGHIVFDIPECNNLYYYPMLYLIKYYVFFTVPDNFATSR